MSVRAILTLILLASTLTGCEKPVPASKASYVGLWEAKNMYVDISVGGRLDYQRKDGSYTSKISAPIGEFHGNDFTAGIPFFETTFVVSTPPHQTPAGWKMVVDGIELTRVSANGENHDSAL